jgi:5'-methylthioadenosine phosphorylase
MLDEARIGVIGGTGIDQIEGLEGRQEILVETPFGPPSSSIILGRLKGNKVAFLPRHGEGHVLMPSEINFRANIYALKKIGIEYIFSLSAVGSLKDHINPLDVVLPDQFYDRTKIRTSSFFGNGIVAHVNFANPICLSLQKLVYDSASDIGIQPIIGGTYICIEGPLFSTKAESNMYRRWGFDVIGMTNIPEAKLAREAEICYCTLALVTDYDCWHEDYEEVDIGMVFENLKINIETAKDIIAEAISNISQIKSCKCHSALENSIITRKNLIPKKIRQDLGILIDKYISS